MKRLVFLLLLALASQKALASNFTGPANLTATGMCTGLRNQNSGSGLVVEVSGITGTAALNLYGSAGGSVWTKLRTLNCSNGQQALTITANGSYTSSASGFRYISLSAGTLSSGLATVSLGWGDGQPCITDGAGYSVTNPSFYILIQTSTLTVTPTITPTYTITTTSTITPTFTITPSITQTSTVTATPGP